MSPVLKLSRKLADYNLCSGRCLPVSNVEPVANAAVVREEKECVLTVAECREQAHNVLVEANGLQHFHLSQLKAFARLKQGERSLLTTAFTASASFSSAMRSVKRMPDSL